GSVSGAGLAVWRLRRRARRPLLRHDRHRAVPDHPSGAGGAGPKHISADDHRRRETAWREAAPRQIELAMRPSDEKRRQARDLAITARPELRVIERRLFLR